MFQMHFSVVDNDKILWFLNYGYQYSCYAWFMKNTRNIIFKPLLDIGATADLDVFTLILQ